MATQFAYIPATSDGCTFPDRGPKPVAIPVRAEEAPWLCLARLAPELAAAPADEGAEPEPVLA